VNVNIVDEFFVAETVVRLPMSAVPTVLETKVDPLPDC